MVAKLKTPVSFNQLFLMQIFLVTFRADTWRCQQSRCTRCKPLLKEVRGVSETNFEKMGRKPIVGGNWKCVSVLPPALII